MTKSVSKSRPKAEDASSALREAYRALACAVEATPDAGDAFERAGAVQGLAAEIARDAATLRARMVLRLQREEGMSLSQLAERIGTSKARADQLVRAAREAEGE